MYKLRIEASWEVAVIAHSGACHFFGCLFLEGGRGGRYDRYVT